MKQNVKSNWSHAILICKKCSRKAKKRGMSFGPDGKSLRSALKSELGLRKGRKSDIGVVEVPCFDVCPKNGIVLVDTRTPGEWRIVGPDTDVHALARQLKRVDQSASIREAERISRP